MTNYKENGKHFIGSSDIARLVLDAPEAVQHLHFGEDGSYSAYIIDGECPVPAHYQLRFTAHSWLKVYDDDGLAASFCGTTINVYRAGEFGCIIQVIK